MQWNYDVIVVGGGHAGAEAAAASARLGARTVLITPDLGRMGQMSCNPAIGGIAKGVVAREVDALGGIMGRATDASRIQFRMLNLRRGPAVWGPRAQCDRELYPRAVRRCLEELPALDLFQGLVTGFVAGHDGDGVGGVETRAGHRFVGSAVVVTTGTFLRGRIHVGPGDGVAGGRAGEAPSIRLSEELERRGLEIARFKTGTPPRVDGRTVDLASLELQPGDAEDYRFSAYRREVVPEQRCCWITWTGPELQRIVSENLERSALYGGRISGQGPRYCPSIEDKVVRFPDARRHQVFLEPEGLETHELYVNGLSTSLPGDVQEAFVRSVPGMEKARLTRLGYAIEYDYFPPHQLDHRLGVRSVPGLFFAGQINGTTGYEEAAGQGVVAGANAALEAQGRGPFVLERDEAYIGVLIDDLVTRGVDEPYRLFTSRSEFRLLLRQDNAIARLGPRARALGMLTPDQVESLEARLEEQDRVRRWFVETRLQPDTVKELLRGLGMKPARQAVRASDLLRRPGVEVDQLLEAAGEHGGFPVGVSSAALASIEVDLKYEGYVARERERAEVLRRRADFALDDHLPYDEFITLSAESREKLKRVRPNTLAQAGRIPGVSQADLQNLVMEVRKMTRPRGTRRRTTS
ncbi:MAG: tRNA uridine-5-carboxymethylaminomethyl(34) synthesis enzyme MnmG [Gemmatimonadetes bacterium]|nr:tRNA uridine-5-carboxymethylaminomethyl(34) synthesis enzyme MnmG [Gemmatimonadota bacterium]NNK65014.1 tRNA uridine-5-carboxymethylaminomethyl(34) synthesis enzyme MnmG [Gemmatimonadota bacterium]